MRVRATLGVIRPCRKRDIDPERPGRKICLYDRFGRRLLGRHPSRAAALRQERAIEIAKHRREPGATQSVIVKTTRARTRTQATKVARKHANRIYTSRETSTSFRFRQRPPSCFLTLRTKCLPNGVCLVVGKLKRGARSRRSCR